MKTSAILPTAALFAALTFSPCFTPWHLRAEDEEAELKALPAAVQKTAHEQIGKSEVEEVEDTFEDGQHATEVEYRENGRKMAVVIAKDGTLIQKEYRMSPADAPEAIKNAVAGLYPDSRISHIKEVQQKGAKFYELAVKAGSKTHELKLDAAGKPLNKPLK